MQDNSSVLLLLQRDRVAKPWEMAREQLQAAWEWKWIAGSFAKRC
jgi:hypothetical protein